MRQKELQQRRRGFLALLMTVILVLGLLPKEALAAANLTNLPETVNPGYQFKIELDARQDQVGVRYVFTKTDGTETFSEFLMDAPQEENSAWYTKYTVRTIESFSNYDAQTERFLYWTVSNTIFDGLPTVVLTATYSAPVIPDGNGEPDPTPTAPANNDEMTSEERRNLEYGKTHPHGEHTYWPFILVEPTDDEDGVLVNRCIYCQFIDYYSKTPISAYGAFSLRTAQMVKQAAPNATITRSTKRWISLKRDVLEALEKRPDVTLKITYVLDGKQYCLTLKGDNPNLQAFLAKDDAFFGFAFLGSGFVNEEVAALQK